MFFKEHIVRFSDGTFGIQITGGWFVEPKYVWLDDNSLSDVIGAKYFHHCQSNDFEEVKKLFDKRCLTAVKVEASPLKSFL